jgi:hypothetical protein
VATSPSSGKTERAWKVIFSIRRSAASLADSCIRLFRKGEATRVSIPYSEISGLALHGPRYSRWQELGSLAEKHREKKQAGEGNIELRPESLD